MSTHSSYEGQFVESSLPKPWESEETFNDVLYDWLRRAPWLAISASAHLVIFFVIQAIPWALFEDAEEVVIVTSIEQPHEELFEDPPEEDPEVVEDVETEETPVVQDVEVAEVVMDDSDEDFDLAEGDPDDLAAAPFDASNLNSVIGIGAGAGSKFGGRFGGSRKGAPNGGVGTGPALMAGLQWLANHQSPDGYWDVDEYMHNCQAEPGECDCEGPGDANQDVGVTGLCLLAFLGDGNTTREGQYQRVVLDAVSWLRNQQDYETGLIGEDVGKHFLYDHAIATLALTEAYYFSKSPTLGIAATRAVRYIEHARDPYGVWRYDVPSLGHADTSVTGWMIFALKSAQESGIQIDQHALDAALAWLDEATDPGNGRVGYDRTGSLSSRVTGVNDHFPAEASEAMTAVGLLSRFFLGQDPDDEPMMEQHADLMLKTLPEWDPEGFGCDMYYWYYGSYAMYQMGGKHWKSWNGAMKSAVLDSQRGDGHAKGSWDPVGPWGHAGGRVYSTALMVLCLEVYFRYSRVIGAR